MSFLSLISSRTDHIYSPNLDSHNETWEFKFFTITHHHQIRRSVFSSNLFDPEHRWTIHAPKFNNFVCSWAYGVAPPPPEEGTYT